jgi:hypothetical protein
VDDTLLHRLVIPADGWLHLCSNRVGSGSVVKQPESPAERHEAIQALISRTYACASKPVTRLFFLFFFFVRYSNQRTTGVYAFCRQHCATGSGVHSMTSPQMYRLRKALGRHIAETALKPALQYASTTQTFPH